VIIRSAVIAPFKSSGEEWDWTFSKKSASQSMIAALGTAMASGDPFSAFAALISGGVFSGLSKPDPYGTAIVYSNGGFSSKLSLATTSTNQENTLTPIWPGGPGWTGVPFESATRIAINLYDEDLVQHDPIGTCEITYKDILLAWNNKTVLQVNVSSQTYNQALFIGISVY